MLSIVDIYVKIAWVAPFDNHVPITGFKVLIKTSSGQYEEFTDVCDGQDSLNIYNSFCTVSMNILWDAPFEYQLNDLIQAKIIATNERGDSLESDAN